MIAHAGANSTADEFWADYTRRSRLVPSLDTTTPLVAAELRRLAERWAAADDLAFRATLAGDPCGAAAALDAKWDAAAAHHALGRDLAELFLLLLRKATEFEPEAVCAYLEETVRRAVRAELEPIARAVAKLERRRCR
jgi:hypothetical protein